MGSFFLASRNEATPSESLSLDVNEKERQFVANRAGMKSRKISTRA